MSNPEETFKTFGEKKETADGTTRGSMPSISLPKGGGAIRGIEEKYSVNPVTGSASFSIPLYTTPGRSDFYPHLSLSYDSGHGNGPFGLGWSLSLPSIIRKTEKGLPLYRDSEESDVFILSGAEDLVPYLEKINNKLSRKVTPSKDGKFDIYYYRPRVEGLFARIEKWVDKKTSKTHWRSISKDNITTTYGQTASARLADPSDSHDLRVFQWLIEESHDCMGNRIQYMYKQEDAQQVEQTLPSEQNRLTHGPSFTNQYIKRIRYGNQTPGGDDFHFEVVFDYGEHNYEVIQIDKNNKKESRVSCSIAESATWSCRPDPFSTYRAGFEVRSYRLCQRVLMFHHFPDEPLGKNCLVHSVDFNYAIHLLSRYSYMTSVSQTGYVRDSQTSSYSFKSLPSVAFTYSTAAIQNTVSSIDPGNRENLPMGIDGSIYQWIDLESEGIPGILTDQAGAWYYKHNQGNGQFAPIELVASKPSGASLNDGRHQLIDLAGDGHNCMVQFARPLAGYYEFDRENGWEPFVHFPYSPNIDFQDPNLKFIDLNGDGYADILITEDDLLVYYLSKNKEGFGPPETVRKALDDEKGPALMFADITGSIFLADMSGDGLNDIVRIRNGEVCYWPNQGYGRFGAKVTMDSAPVFDFPDQFDQRRLRIADVDGTGTTDILYLGRNNVTCWFNQSGNGWSPPQSIDGFPNIDNFSKVMVVDFLGKGTACIVWSSPLPGSTSCPLYYLDLMGEKPHLLKNVNNNMGKETNFYYAQSTKFYLADKANGTPWATKLAFPVHVVEKVETYDWIGRNRFVTRYAYHHGNYDRAEREFRGFGMVEQWDTEEYEIFKGSKYPNVSNCDTGYHASPVLTRTWFHTGAYQDGQRIEGYFKNNEYYRKDINSKALDEIPIPEGLSPQEEREACRSLKGLVLRQETYAQDGSAKSGDPYTVTEHSYTVELVQPLEGNRHAVFLPHPHETIDHHYERNPKDPRISHQLTLEVDPFGNVKKSVAIGYGRRQSVSQTDAQDVPRVPNPDLEELTQSDQSKQTTALITYTETDYTTNTIDSEDNYRTPLAWETRTYELTGFLPCAPDGYYTAEDFIQNDSGIITLSLEHELNYEDAPVSGRERRPIKRARTIYLSDDLQGPLQPGILDPLALTYESYQLTFTPVLIKNVFIDSGKIAQSELTSVLENTGGYLDLDEDGCWWVPSGRSYFSPVPDNPPADFQQNVGYASQHFYLPQAFRDPFGNITRIQYDKHDLLLQETRDAVGNVVTVRTRDEQGNDLIALDYRVMQPWLVVDPNDNRTAVAYDSLRMVTGTAVMGKMSEQMGDSLEGFRADLDQDEIDTFFTDPRGSAAVTLLGNATTRIIYDLTSYGRLNDQDRPVFAASLARETHGNDPLPPDGLKIQVSLSYSDGFGREIQKKIQAEPGDVYGTVADPRWVGSGWTIFNNKGKSVKQYEPFFTATHDFEFAKQHGVSSTLFYDPVGRVVATLHPNHTYEKVLFDPWRQETWDVNDTLQVQLGFNPADDPDVGPYFVRLPTDDYLPTWHALRMDPALTANRWPDKAILKTEQDAAVKAAQHAATSTVAHLDSLGRPFLTLAHNRFERQGATVDETYATRIEMDIEGNQRAVIDARDRVVMRYDYNMLGHTIHQASMEAGARWSLNDTAGKALYAWDNRGHHFWNEYDALHRPVHHYVRGHDEERSDPRTLAADILVQKIEYGEGQANATQFNLRKRTYKSYDNAGVVTSESYDFKGNLLSSHRQLTVDYKNLPNWADEVALETDAVGQPQRYATRISYDALNRPVEAITPDQSISRSAYNEANLLERLDVNLRGTATTTPFVTNIDYNAKGQRTRIDYGNNATTRYEYDPLTFRLVRLHTMRPTQENGLAGQLFTTNDKVQDLRYTYDPAGNITRISDEALLVSSYDHQKIDPVTYYDYDALYRLIKAEGREHIGQSALQLTRTDGNFRDHPFTGFGPQPNDPLAVRNYTERYEYDAVGNFLKFIHRANNGDWQRDYAYEELSLLAQPGETVCSNRLSRTTLHPNRDQPVVEPYSHDAHSNMTRMPHLPLMQWDCNDQLLASAQQVVNNGGTPETTWYVYDVGGRRVRKITERFGTAGEAPTRRKERLYLSGFEIYREYSGDGATRTLERETLHVMDDKRRIALVETKTVGSGNTGESHDPAIRYQLDNHLGSASLELDLDGSVISYEEYHPYGTTSFQAGRSTAEVSLKRYRYTGIERDEETGLNYHSARYYALWLGRWVNCDPAGFLDGTNLYQYSQGNPVRYSDPRGEQSNVPPAEPLERAERAVAAVLFGGRPSDQHATNMDLFLRANYGQAGTPSPKRFNLDAGRFELRRTVRASGRNPIDIVRDITNAANSLKGDSARTKSVALVLHGNTDKIGRENPGVWLTESMLRSILVFQQDEALHKRYVERAKNDLEEARKTNDPDKIQRAAANLTTREASLKDFLDDPNNQEARDFSDAFRAAANALNDAGVQTLELQTCNTGAGTRNSFGFLGSLKRLLQAGGNQVEIKAHSEAITSRRNNSTVSVWLGQNPDAPNSQKSTTTLPMP